MPWYSSGKAVRNGERTGRLRRIRMAAKNWSVSSFWSVRWARDDGLQQVTKVLSVPPEELERVGHLSVSVRRQVVLDAMPRGIAASRRHSRIPLPSENGRSPELKLPLNSVARMSLAAPRGFECLPPPRLSRGRRETPDAPVHFVPKSTIWS